MTTNIEDNKIIYKDLSYKLQGLFFDIRNDLGSGHKESIYQKALEKELVRAGVKFAKEPSIKIYSQKGEFLGLYRPDFLIEDKIIIELKAAEDVTKQEMARVYDYLRNSNYELAYLVNFASQQLFIKRFLFTNNRKLHFNPVLKSFAVLFVAISLLFVDIRGILAAEFYFKSDQQTVGIGQKITVDVYMNSPEGVNAVEGKIMWPAEYLEFKDACECGSIISLWVEKFKLNQDKTEVSFAGVVPGGFSALDGKLFSIDFIAKKSGVTSLTWRDTRALLNDGQGTVAILGPTPFKITITKSQSEQKEEMIDTISPEPFTPIIARDKNIFDNQWFLSFTTQDKQTGIDHYEILESKIKNQKEGWIMAESPYLLKDQTLKSYIYVKAVDKQGNERVAEIWPKRKHWYLDYRIWGIIIVLLLILRVIWRRLKSKIG